MKKYQTMSTQYSRGCPFNCEFCQIPQLFGRKVRTKTKEQIIKELDILYNSGWKGAIFFVDDNFIGNKHKLKTELLPGIIEWMEKRKHPFEFLTQASMNLADDEELMRMMVHAGFDRVFVGVESFDDDCLVEAGKWQNRNRDLVANVKKMHKFGLQVQGGFIVGFDNDKSSVFNKMTQFIQESGIVTAMVGMLNVMKGTKLYDRIKGEERLTSNAIGNNTDFTINFIPKMSKKTLLEGYKKILKNIYSPKQYYLRVQRFLKDYNPLKIKKGFDYSYLKKNYFYMKGFIKSIFILGILDKGRVYYWKLFFWSAFRRPKLFRTAMIFSAYGYHFRKVFRI